MQTLFSALLISFATVSTTRGEEMTCHAVSAAGMVAFIDASGTVRLWSAAHGDGPAIAPAEGHFTCATFDPAGRELTAGRTDGAVCVYDLAGQLLEEAIPPAKPGSDTAVRAVDCGPGGRMLLFRTKKALVLYDRSEARITWEGPPSRLHGWGLDRLVVVQGTLVKSVSPETGGTLAEHPAPGPISCLDVHRATDAVVIGCENGSLSLWNREGGLELFVESIDWEPRRVTSVQLDSAGRLVLAANHAGTVCLLRRTGGPLWTRNLGAPVSGRMIARFGPSESDVLISGCPSWRHLLSAATGEVLAVADRPGLNRIIECRAARHHVGVLDHGIVLLRRSDLSVIATSD